MEAPKERSPRGEWPPVVPLFQHCTWQCQPGTPPKLSHRWVLFTRNIPTPPPHQQLCQLTSPYLKFYGYSILCFLCEAIVEKAKRAQQISETLKGITLYHARKVPSYHLFFTCKELWFSFFLRRRWWTPSLQGKDMKLVKWLLILEL